MAKAGKLALVKASGAGVSITAEATTATGNISYQITNTARQVLDRTATITVKNAGVPTVEAYTLNRLTGTVTFGSAVARTITIDGTYLPLSTIAEAHEYNYGVSKSLLQDTAFGDSFNTQVDSLKSVSGSLSRWRTTDTYFSDAIIAGAPVVIEFWSDSTTALDFKIWALLNTDQYQSAVTSLVDESVSFESTTDADGRSISS